MAVAPVVVVVVVVEVVVVEVVVVVVAVVVEVIVLVLVLLVVLEAAVAAVRGQRMECQEQWSRLLRTRQRCDLKIHSINPSLSGTVQY